MARSALCRRSHTPTGRPKPCFFLAMVSVGSKSFNASLKKGRNCVPFNFYAGGSLAAKSITSSSSIGNATSMPRSSQIDSIEKFGRKDIPGTEAFQQIVAFVAIRHRQRRLRNVALCPAEQCNAVCQRKASDQGCDEAATKELWNAVVAGEQLLCRIAGIAAKKLVA